MNCITLDTLNQTKNKFGHIISKEFFTKAIKFQFNEFIISKNYIVKCFCDIFYNQNASIKPCLVLFKVNGQTCL